MNTDNTRLVRLNSKLNRLQENLNKEIKNGEDIQTTIDAIKSLEEEQSDFKKLQKLEAVNKSHKEQRNILKEVLNIDLPKEDIRTADNSFHAIKVKKYPALCEFLKKYKYATFKFENGEYTRLELGRHTYYLSRYKSEYGQPTKQIPFENFEEALKHNAIQAKPMTFKKYKSLEGKVLKESNRIKAEIEKSEAKLKALNVYFLECENLINRQRPTYSQYYSI